ncbi:hypothetical protein T484DRAFT_1757185, partial [Baffinella frigidus]
LLLRDTGGYWLTTGWILPGSQYCLCSVWRSKHVKNHRIIHFNYIAEQTLFGGNETRVVGLGGSSYALTDGNSVQYTFYRGVAEQVFSRDHWPFKIEPALGIAAIEYDSAEAVDDSGSRTLSMLGCVCQDVVDESVDQGTRMQIHCSVARYQSEDADEALDTSGLHVPVSFALPSTEGYLKCARAKIVVDSVRWPLSRLSVPGTLASGGRNWYNPLDELASSDGTDGPVEIDAAIWVVPACGAEGVFDPVCARSFEKAACFPYCLAVRAKGSASRGMVLYNADDWTENVQLQNRDCGISQLQSTGLTSNTKYSDSSDIPKNYRAIMTDLLDILDKRVVVVDSETPATYDPVTMMCVSSETVSSRMNRSAVAGIDSRYEAILMEGQPFAVTGGVALIPVDNSDGTVRVRVQRLYGDEGTYVFTMVTTHANLPAIKPCETPSGCDKLPRDDLVSIPYPWYSTPARHNPAVETRWGVFYAVNPSMDMFSEFAKMCQNRTDYKLQIEALSSYGGIRIWRVDAFAFTTPDSSTGSTGSSIEFPDVFSKDSGSLAVCGNPFNVLVTSMEYLNADNVAIQVMHAAPAYLNTSTMAPLGNDPQKVTYRTYFLHPVTMQLNETHMWQADSAIAQLSSGGSALCPGLRQMPQFGSMAAEMAASLILATRMMVTFIVSAPTVMQKAVIPRLTECPLVHRGHTMMLNCGRNLLSLDASFSAMRVANSHFWNSLAKLGRLISGLPGGSSIQTLLEGSAAYNMQIRTPLLRRNSSSKSIDRAYRQVHEFATKQYRSLLQDANKIPKYTVDMIKETGTKTMLFAQKLLADSKKFATRANGYKMGAQFVTATPGNFIRRLPGASIGVAAFGASVIDTSQFAWRFVTRLVLKLLAVNEGMSLAPALWQATADSMDDYTTYLVKPAFRACSDIGVMMGFSNPWARLFRESCSAAVASQATAVSTGLVLFVDIPTLACMCKDADGRNYAIYARETCWTPAPLHIRPLLASLISDYESGLGQKDICQKMGLYTEDKMRAIMDPVMQHGYAATEAVGSSLDYLTTLFDPNAGSCKDVINSPYTMALVPEPVDYFRGCAKTQSCRSRCITLFNEFEDAKSRTLESKKILLISKASMVGLDQDAANAEAVRTMTAAATTNFLTQIALGVLYPPIVFKKTIICHTDAFLSTFDVTGFKLRISSQKYAAPTNALVGRCLSEYHKESLQDPQSQDSQTGFAAVLQGIAIDAGTAIAQIPFERMLHAMDAAFAYTIGVVSGLQDVVATADQRHCNLPDIEAADISTCSCGDTPMMIPDDRADSEGSRFWCTGVLSLISSTGEAYLGINPYTYAQITHMSSSQDTYLECVSAGNTDAPCNKGPPNDYAYGGHLAIQGISLMTVATRCKSNYANSQWDDGAAALFSDPLPKSLAGTNTRKTHELRESFIQNVDPTVVACLVLSLQEGGSNDACLQDFLTQRNQRRQSFFQYIPVDSHRIGTQFIAACEVFTGPATSTSMSADAKLPFKQCLNEYPDVGCTTPGMVWAGRSANRVSVATTHARVDSDHSRRLQIARATLIKVRTDVLATLNDQKITSWNADLLELAIFTAEGDALHQLFDALVLGPYARAGMWPTDIEHQLPRLDWYRDTHGGTTREFELPCAGDSLRGVHTAPYTCGSATRRSVIRYFMKEVFSTGKEELNNAVQRAVHAMISNLKSVWSADYGCECATDNHLKLAIAMVIAEWVDDWVCDSMAPSESWGVLNETNMQNWMAGNSSSLSIRETLQHGRVGIRVGSFASVIGDKEWKRVLNPGRRTIPLTGLHNGTVGQRWCMRNHAEMLPASFADRFVDELFPIAQGVTESAGLAFCLRVVVESARLRVLQLAAAGTSGDVSKRLYEAIEGQENVLSTWRRRCMQQVDMVGMCMLRGVFAVQPVLEPIPKCPFELTHMPQNGAWLTPGCVLRWTDDRYFYPCLCNDCSRPLILSVIHDVVNKGSCEMAINPNTFLLEYKKKSSLFWATDFTHEKDTLKRSMLTAQVLALHEERKHNTGVDIQKLLTDYIHSTDTVNEPRGTFGNADGSTKWFAAEGLAHDGSTQFCDIIHDWWPESWEQPV